MKENQTQIEVRVHDSYKGKNIETARGVVMRKILHIDSTRSQTNYYVSIKGKRRRVTEPLDLLPHVTVWESELPRDLDEYGY